MFLARRGGRTLSAGVVWPLQSPSHSGPQFALVAPPAESETAREREPSEWPGPGAPRAVREKAPRLAAEVSKNLVIAISYSSVFLDSKLPLKIWIK